MKCVARAFAGLILLLAVLSGLPRAGHALESADIFLINIGWHSGIALERRYLREAFGKEIAAFPDAGYFEFGWGDEGFYRADDPGVWLALRAVFASAATVVHFVALSQHPARAFPQAKVTKLKIDGNGLKGLLTFLHSAMARDAAGQSQPLGPGLYMQSQFYLARGQFGLFNNCNRWSARALVAAGLNIDSDAVLTAEDIEGQIAATRR